MASTSTTVNASRIEAQSTPAAAASKFPPCDLVMKGGITSGVVYPKLIWKLAAKYRFKNIGGTSAGAIAAAACAAAEYGRQHNKVDSFDQLRELPRLLGAPAVGSGDAQSMLFHLFQPAPAVRRHFAVLVSMLNAGPWQAVGSALLTMLRQFLGFALLGLAIALLLVTPVISAAAPYLGTVGSIGIALTILVGWALWTVIGLARLGGLSLGRLVIWLAVAVAFTALALVLLGGAAVDWRLLFLTAAVSIAALLSIAVVLATAGAKFLATLLTGMHKNFYGMCSGRTMIATRAGPAGLTDWLTRYFNELAGLGPDGRPLIFGDLWGETQDADDDAAARRINLEVMTTAVSQQMCYSIPFRDGTPSFFYDEDEWSRLFPDAVIDWLQIAPRGDVDKEEEGRDTDEAMWQVVNAAGKRLRRLPANRNLPVVVAVRMSLSFPILLSAVPLYAIDWSLKGNAEAKRLARARAGGAAPKEPVVLNATRVWFSDGGIASNMPLHFFDALLPNHPTFAVNLKKPHPDHPIEQGGRIYLPESNAGGRLRYWPEPDDATPAGGLKDFLVGIIDTMQNWRDEIQFPYPGYRDRIVQISQRDDEGGLNLDMPEGNIRALSDAGEMAADALIARFHQSGAQSGQGWSNHEEVRLTTFLGLLERMGLSLNARLHGGNWTMVTQRVVASNRYTESEGRMATDYLDRLRDMGDAMKSSDRKLQNKSLKPRADLRISPRI